MRWKTSRLFLVSDVLEPELKIKAMPILAYAQATLFFIQVCYMLSCNPRTHGFFFTVWQLRLFRHATTQVRYSEQNWLSVPVFILRKLCRWLETIA